MYMHGLIVIIIYQQDYLQKQKEKPWYQTHLTQEVKTPQNCWKGVTLIANILFEFT